LQPGFFIAQYIPALSLTRQLTFGSTHFAETFRWNEWNIEHEQNRRCIIEEIESVVNSASRGFPRKIGDDTKNKRPKAGNDR